VRGIVMSGPVLLTGWKAQGARAISLA
jgi:hypothetical protein